MAVAGGKAKKNTSKILSIVVFNAITYILIGLPLAVFPGLVHFKLGYSATLAGGLISLQYVATLLTRSPVGRLCDQKGGKVAVMLGLGCAAVNGVFILLAGHAQAPLLVLALLFLSRLMLGAAESGCGTGCNIWGMARLGPAASAEVMSWNGIASYGGIALGAPLGVMLMHFGGLDALGGVAVLLPLLGLLGGCFSPAAKPLAGAKRVGMLRVVRDVWAYGSALACASFGFGVIVAFMALYYAAHGWHGAAYALTSFGVCFVLVRLVLVGVIGRFGGFRVALVSYVVEAVGLVLLWQASAPVLALLGAGLAGFGLSLIFPALGVEVLKTVDSGNRGSALAIYTVFLDIALGLTGPVAGEIAGAHGYPAAFGLGAVVVCVALVLTAQLFKAARVRAAQSL